MTSDDDDTCRFFGPKLTSFSSLLPLPIPPPAPETFVFGRTIFNGGTFFISISSVVVEVAEASKAEVSEAAGDILILFMLEHSRFSVAFFLVVVVVVVSPTSSYVNRRILVVGPWAKNGKIV